MAATGQYTVRWRWLRFMYIYTIIIAGLMGLSEILAPTRVQCAFGMPAQDPMVFGLAASMFLAMALVAILGLRAPLKYSPIILIEILYKLVWFCGVALPLALRGQFPASSVVQLVVFVTFVVGGLIAVPFRYLFARDVRLSEAGVEVVDYH